MSLSSQTLIKNAVEYHSLTSKKGIMERLFTLWFDGFVYNQIWEDPRVDAAALDINPESRILTISSGGCNLLNYLIHNPKSIHAVDLNQYHLYFTQLKLAALKHLPSHDDFFDFYGYADKKKNVDNYFGYIQPYLHDDIREFWESSSLWAGRRINYFTNNLYLYGTMGYFIRFVHFMARHLSHDPKDLLKCKTKEEQLVFFKTHYEPFFENPIVKWLSQKPFLLYSLGIPPQQFQSMKDEWNGSLSELLKERVSRLAADFSLEDNYYAWQAFGCKYDTDNRQALPDYLKKENYQTIKENLPAISLENISTTAFLKKQPVCSLNAYVYLDSMDWMDAESIIELWTETARTAMPGSRIIFRTAAETSPIEAILPAKLRCRFIYEEKKSLELHKQDRSAIYGGFHLYRFIK